MVEMGIPKDFGRKAFGNNPANYHRSRPPYPAWVFDTLRARLNASGQFSAFEIGAGTGTATSQLLDLGANPLLALEPDARLASFLKENYPDPALTVIESTFEAADLPEAGFDLGVCATAFHWLDEGTALDKIARLLRPGGWWAAVWNVFGDPDQPDPFHEATLDLLAAPASPSATRDGLPFGLDSAARISALNDSGAFDRVESHSTRWPLILDADETVALYATFSNITARDDRDYVLSELRRIANEAFGGRVVRNMTTSLYLARKF